MMMRFVGKTVVVTGAARRIGRAVAEAFAGEGARVFAAYSSPAAPIPGAESVAVDVAVEERGPVRPDDRGQPAGALSVRPIRGTILPGWIDVSGEPLRDIDHAQHPAGRVGRPPDIARACLFLASPEEAEFMTGQTMVIDGGMTVEYHAECPAQAGFTAGVSKPGTPVSSAWTGIQMTWETP